jgi:hypothetical protein
MASTASGTPGGPVDATGVRPITPINGGGGMEELLPLVLQLTNAEQVRVS